MMRWILAILVFTSLIPAQASARRRWRRSRVSVVYSVVDVWGDAQDDQAEDEGEHYFASHGSRLAVVRLRLQREGGTVVHGRVGEGGGDTSQDPHEDTNDPVEEGDLPPARHGEGEASVNE